MAVPPRTKKSQRSCGIACCKWKFLQKFAKIRLFVFIMCCIIAVQGAYLGYMVGVLTSIERHFDISSSESGTLLSMYDIGHTVTVIFVGYFGANRHKPRWTGVGVVLSAIAMIGLALPNFLFGPTAFESDLIEHHENYVNMMKCDPRRSAASNTSSAACNTVTHAGAYAMLALSQLLAGVAAAPFNTLAYVYIDDNVSPRQSPFFLGLMTSMYAFGPAFGFALSAGCNSLFVAPMAEPMDVDMKNPNWVGAWWLGYLICAGLYIILAVPIFCFPKKMKHMQRSVDENNFQEMEEMELNQRISEESQEQAKENICHKIGLAVRDLPYGIVQLVKNPVYVSMAFGWILGSYLVGGYGTYLPKYIETQYGQTAAMSDIFAGIISIGSVAVSTAVGGYILTRFNIHPRKAVLFLTFSWAIIVLTYLIGMVTGCPQPTLVSKKPSSTHWEFSNSCNQQCVCNNVHQFDPICSGNLTYFSPCHAGCTYENSKWTTCVCTDFPNKVSRGYCPVECTNLPIYIAVMFIGLFIGNIFFMTTMMVVLRCVRDEQKSLALSIASCVTNIFGFIPSPIVFGAIIDTSCVQWHSLCPTETGNCILYNNRDFRHKFHLCNAAFQFAAVLAVIFTWFKARTFKFPEEEQMELSVSADMDQCGIDK